MSYLITATFLLFAVWPAYYFLLRYSGRYGLNRLLLLLAMVATVALPFVSFDSPAPVVTQTVHTTIDFVSGNTQPTLDLVREDTPVDINADAAGSYQPEAVPAVSMPTWALVYNFGFCLLLLTMLIRLAILLSLHLRSRPNGDRSYRLLHPGAKSGQAFTFGRQLYFSIDVPDSPDFEHVLAHERVHARQLHSVDILLTELFLCVFWFHPVAWWLRAQTRANLEYLADRSVLRGGSDRRSYQLALVRRSQAAHGLALTLPFSEPSLKSRIARMTGLPEYRVVALMAAVALLFWLGVAVVTINGKVFEGTPEGEDYSLAEGNIKQQLSRSERLRKLLNIEGMVSSEYSSQSISYSGTTYREWYEALRWPADRDESYFYNDKPVSRDFLLDTDFGPNSLMQSGVVYDTPLGRYALQVIDDGPIVTGRPNNLTATAFETLSSFTATDLNRVGVLTEATELDLYFRRIPTPYEVEVIRRLISSHVDLEFLVYQDCQYAEGNYSFGLNRLGGSTPHSFSNLAVGETYNDALRLQLKRNGSSSGISTFRPRSAPADAPDEEVFFRADGEWFTITSANNLPYKPTGLDPVPASVSLACLVFDGQPRAGRPYWTASRSSLDGAFEHLLGAVQEAGLNNRPLTFYINETPVEVGEFGNYAGSPNAYMQVGAINDGGASTVVAQIIDRP